MQGDVPIFARAHGTLMGAAIGDALGMPSQTLPVDQIKARYGQITDFVAPYDNHPVSHGLHAGQVTDDTEQTLLLARRLILGQGQIDDAELAKDLLSWEAQVKDRGLRDLLGPSSKAALDAMLSGTPITETGRNGTTNGAAMRITPIGIAFRVEPISDFVDEVQSACRLTHNTREAIAAAAAVAAVVSAGLEGRGLEAALEAALKAAEEGQRRGYSVGDAAMADRIRDALTFAGQCQTAADLAKVTGTSVASHESVAAAFGLVRMAKGDPWQAALMAANIGDDTDTIGSICCAMAGACAGINAFPPSAVKMVNSVNTLLLEEIAYALLALRDVATSKHQRVGAGE